jgi:hypothetical protein
VRISGGSAWLWGITGIEFLAFSGQWSVVSGQWSVISGQFSAFSLQGWSAAAWLPPAAARKRIKL